MKRESKNILLMTGLTLTVAMGWLGYGVRYDALDAYREWRRGPIPDAVSRLDFERAVAGVPTAQAEGEAFIRLEMPEEEGGEVERGRGGEDEQDIVAESTVEENETPKEEIATSLGTPATINLQIPFMVQAPNADWDELHDAACEEAAAIMLTAYYEGETEITTDEAETRIMDAVTWEAETFGYHLDTTSAETAQMIREHFGLANAQVFVIDSIDDIKERLAAGHPVIVPAYGKILGNPNFRNGGPLYHNLVIKGYTDTKFITNDPGTRRGADYVYDFETLWNAIHDWNGGDVPNGAKVMIAVQ